MLTGEGLKQSYGGFSILKGVSLAIEPGRITCLIGPSGSGKTTMLKTLSLLDPPEEGLIVLDGHDYRFPGTKSFTPPWPLVTVVFQQQFLWPHLSLRDNILLPLRRTGNVDSLDYFVKLFEMEDFISRYPNEVSLGQRQRAALARALVLQPRYLLLDEITAALDVEQVKNLLRYLLILRGRGIGILLVTHSIHFARALLSEVEGDHVAVLDRGVIIEAGTKELLSEPKNDRVRRFLSAMSLVD